MTKIKKAMQGEITLNAQLADALAEPLALAGIPDVVCQEIQRRTPGHPDIRIADYARRQVVVECKINDPNLTRAKADAEGRLTKMEKLIGLVAVSYNTNNALEDLTWAFRRANSPRWENPVQSSDYKELRLRLEQAFWPAGSEVDKSIAQIRAAVHQFTLACRNNKIVAKSLAKTLQVGYKQVKSDKKRDALRREMAVVAGLVLMSAMIFHRRLAQESADEFDELDGHTIHGLGGLHKDVTATELADVWKKIQKVNYVAIFSLAQKLLEDCTGIFPNKSISLFGEVADSCIDYAKAGNDFMGRIFHEHLTEQKALSAYYTNTHSALLLANMVFDSAERLPRNALKSARDFENLTVMDPACGTGTLLLAAAVRLGELSEGNIGPNDFHRILMENVIKGMDVLDVGVVMAATSLGMMAPNVQFKHCGIRGVDMQVTPKPERRAILGSLEWFNQNDLFQMDTAKLRNIETGEGAPADKSLDWVDVVIMNPPFAIGQPGSTSFSFIGNKADEKLMKERYKNYGMNFGFGSGSGAGPGFLQLAARRTKEGARFGTIIGVALGTGGKAYGTARRNLSRYFDLDTVVISRDPKRINFSDSTSINELMVVGTRNATRFRAPDTCTRSHKTAFVILTHNPTTPAKAATLARLINDIDRSKPRGTIQGFGQYVMDESRDVASWDILNFANPDLSMFLRKVGDGKMSGLLSGIVPMLVGGVGEKTAALGVRKCYRLNKHTEKQNKDDTLTDAAERERGNLFLQVANRRDKRTYPVRWEGCPEENFGGYFLPPERDLIEVGPNAWVNPTRGGATRARNYFADAGHFGIRISFGVTTSHTLAVRFTEPMLSCSFLPFTLHDDPNGKKTKAMVAWLNCTLGIGLLVKHSTVAGGSKVQFTGHGAKNMAWLDVSRLPPAAISDLAAAYDTMRAEEKAGKRLGKIGDIAKDRQRAKLDRMVAKALGIKGDFRPLREMMAGEMIFAGLDNQPDVPENSLMD